MTSDYSALLRGVLIDPADDLPRLVFADWLADNGEEDRGEFIRESIRKNRNPSEGDYGDLQSVLERHWRSWVPECGNGRIGFELRRGFVAEVRLPLAEFLERAKELFETHPIERVVLTDRNSAAQDPNFFCWYGNNFGPPGFDDGMADVLPEAIFEGLKHPQNTPARYWLYFSSAEAADAALSAACVRYARQSAGLPPMPVAVPEGGTMGESAISESNDRSSGHNS